MAVDDTQAFRVLCCREEDEMEMLGLAVICARQDQRIKTVAINHREGLGWLWERGGSEVMFR